MATTLPSLETPLATTPSLTLANATTTIYSTSFPILGVFLLKMVTTFGIIGGGGIATTTLATMTTSLPGEESLSSEYLPTATETVEMKRRADGDFMRSFTFRRDPKGIRGFGNVFGYLTSPWAMFCIFMTILLNRTHIYASLRRPIRLSFKYRFLIRILPIFLLLGHIRKITFAMRCQTSNIHLEPSPEAIRISYSDDTQEGFFYYLSRFLTIWYPTSASDVSICQLASMLPYESSVPRTGQWKPAGSVSLLWPLYKTISLSLFVSTFSHALTGRSSAASTSLPSSSSETGLSLFEVSLAFAEAEALADLRTGNVSPHILYIALITSCAHLTCQIIGLLCDNCGRSGGFRYRLISSGFWGMAFLGGFAWSILKGNSDVLNYPTVCIVGFIPHLFVLFGILMCGQIYIIAAFFSTFGSPSPSHSSTETRTAPSLSFQNLQANITLSTLSISLSEDFYTALLKVGFMCLTAASAATYLNEGDPITLPGLTWLEKERIRILERERQWSLTNAAKISLIKGQTTTADGKGGYNNEQKEIHPQMVGLEDRFDGMAKMGKPKRGLGGTRGRRLVLALEFLRGLAGVCGRWIIRLLTSLLRLLRLIGRRRNNTDSRVENVSFGLVPEKTILNAGSLQANLGANELSMRESELATQRVSNQFSYGAFLTGPLDSEEDDSGDYVPTESEDWRSEEDTRYTSDEDEAASQLLSEQSEWSSLSGSELSEDDDGHSTPRARSPRAWESSNTRNRNSKQSYRQENPLQLLEMLEAESNDPSLALATLLDPQTPEQRNWAKILARHLSSNKIITRRQNAELDKSILLAVGRRGKKGIIGASGYGYLGNNQDVDSDILESVITERRGMQFPSAEMLQGNPEDDTTAPSCVICQSSPRTIITWPCRCMALCEECRVSLAMRNFGTCVCCRRDVEGFSRVWVP